MKSIFDVVMSWKQLWQHPQLALMLLTTSSAATLRDGTDESEEDQLERLLLRDLAAPETRKSVFAKLVDEGEFELAAKLLDREGFRASSGEADLGEFNERLKAGRLMALEQLQARLALLSARKHRVNYREAFPAGLENAVSLRTSAADELLLPWQEGLAGAEQALAAKIRDRAERQLQGDESEAAQQWRKSIERCLETGEFLTAEFLLEQGVSRQVPETPALIPRVEDWPHGDSLPEVLDWYADRGASPIGFHEAWQPRGAAGQRLLLAIRRLLEDFDEPAAAEFAAAFENALQPDDAPQTPKVETIPQGFAAQLHCLRDERLPRFWKREAVELRMRRVALSRRKTDVDAVQPFTLEFQVGDSECSADISWQFLLALIRSPRYRRINVLREIASQMSPAELVPDSCLDQLELPQSVESLRSWVRWFFDLAGLRSIDETTCDSIVFYSGQRTSVLLRFSRHVLGSTSSFVSAPLLDEAWQNPDFRAAAIDDLLSPILDDTAALATLGFFLQFVPRDVAFQGGGWSDYLDLPEEKIGEALARLAELQLIKPDKREGHYVVPNTGPTFLLLESPAGSEECLAKWISELKSPAPVPSPPDHED